MTKPQVTFSPNPIHLDVTGLRLSELAFIDLPSAKIIGVGASREILLSAETNLIKLYLDNEQALILLIKLRNRNRLLLISS